MALLGVGRLLRFLRSVSIPLSTFIAFSCALIFIFILYQPTPGPGLLQRLGWQSWDSVSLAPKPNLGSGSSSSTGNTDIESPQPTEWWNVSQQEDAVDWASLPLDEWTPLLPHDTGFSEIAVTHCYVNPRLASVCDPDSTPEQDAKMGKFVRVDRNLNFDAGYFSGYLNVYYRRTRRQDVNLITDIKLLPADQSPSSTDWVKVPTSLRSGVTNAPALYLWYQLGKTAGQMNKAEKANLITELDVLYGDDVAWYGFEKLKPATLVHDAQRQDTWLTMRRGVKPPPRAQPLHFSHDGKFKILQIADLHYSVAKQKCRDTPPDFACSAGADNTTAKTLVGAMLDIEKPDLVVFTGDQLNGQGTDWDPKSILAKFSREVADRGIPWAAVFGNHDEENGVATKETQVKMLKALPYSLMEAGPKDIHGVGNYVLKVKSADPSAMHLLTLYFLDTGSYSRGFYNLWGWFTPTAYDYIRQDQIDWFMQESAAIKPIQRPFTPDNGQDLGHIWKREDQLTPQTTKLAKPNAMMFFHMPLPETYDKADVGPSGRPLDVGITGQEEKGNAKENAGFFKKGILQAAESDNARDLAPEVKIIGNGHCHLTENCRRVSGVWFCFGGGGSYAGYGKLGFDRRFRVYDISDYGETIRTYKRTEHDNFEELLDDMVLVGKNART